jgi:hypothetical protein
MINNLIQKENQFYSKNIYLKKDTTDLHQSVLFQLKGFIQTRFFGKNNPHYEKYLLLNKVRTELKQNGFAKQYIDKSGNLSTKFAQFLLSLYQYAKPLKEKVNWEPLFNPEKFPLFLVNEASTPYQKDLYSFLVSKKKLQNLIEEKGIQNTKSIIKDVFNQYKNSFTAKQTLEINSILSLGTELYSFISFDFMSLIHLFYPEFQDTQVNSLKSPNPVNTSLHLNTIINFLNHLSSINPDGEYFYFLKNYGLYLKQRIISEKDFNLFLNNLLPFVRSNFLINLIKINKSDSLFRATPTKEIHKKPEMSKILRFISSQIQENHTQVTQHLKEDTQGSLLKLLFDDNFIKRIQEQQLDVNQKMSPLGQKSYTMHLIVLNYFNELFFEKEILKTSQSLLETAIFNKKELKNQFIDCFKKLKKIFFYASSTISSFRKLEANYLEEKTVAQLETGALTILQNFIKNAQEFLSLLQMISQNAQEDLQSGENLTVSKKMLEQILFNTKESFNMIKNLQFYIKVSLTLV